MVSVVATIATVVFWIGLSNLASALTRKLSRRSMIAIYLVLTIIAVTVLIVYKYNLGPSQGFDIEGPGE